MLNALSFDVEEYFQVANLRHAFPRDGWEQVDSRLHIGMEALLGALERHRAHATFFFLGWIAEQHPEWIRRCLEAGHEVASHGYEHEFLWDLGPDRFEQDLVRTEDALVAAGAPKPRGFRASTFTLTRETWWAFETLARRGYRYDSSVHPVRHPVYGVPDFDPGISTVSTPAGEIVEFPVATWRAFGRNLPVGGGGYFRLLPLAITRRAFARLERAGTPGALYLHPWEFDPAQPKVPAPWSSTFRHRLNLSRTLGRLEGLMKEFRFGSFEDALLEIGALAPLAD